MSALHALRLSVLERIFECMGAREPSWASVNEALIAPQPISLSPAELGDDPAVEAKGNIPVVAWVRFPETPIRVEGRVLRWTDKAVELEWKTSRGATHRAWVWKGAAVPGQRDDRK